MPLWAAAIAVGGSALNSKINSNRGTENPASDSRTIDYQKQLEEMLQSTSNQETRNSIQEMLSQLQSSTQENTNQTSEQVGQQTGSVNRGDAATNEALQGLLQGGGPDGNAAMDAAIQRVLRTGAPAIANSANNAGAFNSTVQAQLQNDLTSKAAEAAAGIDLNQQNANRDALLDAIRAGQAGTESNVVEDINKATGTTSTDSTTNESTTQNTSTNENLEGTSTTNSTNVSQGIGDSYTDISSDDGLQRPVGGSPINQWIGSIDPITALLGGTDGGIPRAPVDGPANPQLDTPVNSGDPQQDYIKQYSDTQAGSGAGGVGTGRREPRMQQALSVGPTGSSAGLSPLQQAMIGQDIMTTQKPALPTGSMPTEPMRTVGGTAGSPMAVNLQPSNGMPMQDPASVFTPRPTNNTVIANAGAAEALNGTGVMQDPGDTIAPPIGLDDSLFI